MEEFNDALCEAIKAAGGSSNIGPKLWPEKEPKAAQRLLLDCLNNDRPAHLTPDQLILVLRLARNHGHHGAFEFMSAALGYARPIPIDPKDEIAELQRQFIAATKQSEQSAARMHMLVERMETMNHARPHFLNS
jgi:hypothetical protein